MELRTNLVGSQAEVTLVGETVGSVCIGDPTASTQDECETMLQIGEWKKNETLTSTWALFFLQAINYPILWLTLTAVENSFLRASRKVPSKQETPRKPYFMSSARRTCCSGWYLHALTNCATHWCYRSCSVVCRVKFIALMIQITMITPCLFGCFPPAYIANKNFNPAFSSMRILSLGAFIAMRLGVSGREETNAEPFLLCPRARRWSVRALHYAKQTRRATLLPRSNVMSQLKPSVSSCVRTCAACASSKRNKARLKQGYESSRSCLVRRACTKEAAW